jgi:hypothetical protein
VAGHLGRRLAPVVHAGSVVRGSEEWGGGGWGAWACAGHPAAA